MAGKKLKDSYIYPAIFSFGKGGYTVTFPDLPGCITQGDDVPEALAMAKEALELTLFCLEEENEKIKPPCSRPEKIKLPPRSFISMIEIWMPKVRAEMKREEKIINLCIEKLPEGLFLATSDDVQGLVAQGHTLAGTIEIACDVACKLLAEQKIICVIKVYLDSYFDKKQNKKMHIMAQPFDHFIEEFDKLDVRKQKKLIGILDRKLIANRRMQMKKEADQAVEGQKINGLIE